MFSSCLDALDAGRDESGITTIADPARFGGSLNVYCDQESFGGGWMVVQRRGQFGNPIDYFDRVRQYFNKKIKTFLTLVLFFAQDKTRIKAHNQYVLRNGVGHLKGTG